jgi:tripartite-type tricarboxylate transporter receptor subunit TctC
VPELISHLKTKPAKVLHGVPTTSVLAASELFKLMTGTQGQPVNYRSMADVTKDITSGDVDYTFIDATNGLAQAKAGRMHILGTSTASRLAVAPDLPTLSEAGLKDYEYINFWGAYLAAKSPPEAIAKLSGWLDQVVRMEDTRKFLLDQASEPWPSTPESLTKQMVEHDALWQRIVKAAKIEPQ